MKSKIKFLAYYLPQYHPIPENDKWWGKGFTEWTNVTKAKPLFKGHEQPILPGELGFYDLRLPEVQEQQSELALEYGIDGFIYYQYWFGNGKMLLEKPAEAMLRNKKIGVPFCFCWANETWKGVWHGLDNPKVLIEQSYNGEEDYIAYFNYLLPFFKDERYIKVDNKPMFHVYRLDDIPDLKLFLDTFNSLAKEYGFNGVYVIATGNVDSYNVLNNHLINGVVGTDLFRKLRYSQLYKFKNESFLNKIERVVRDVFGFSIEVGTRKKPLIFDYKKGLEMLKMDFPNNKYISCVIPNWDNSARSGNKSLIFRNANPKVFYEYFCLMMQELNNNIENPPFIIIKSWNEWAEGNYIEPDQKFGRKWLQAIKEIEAK